MYNFLLLCSYYEWQNENGGETKFQKMKHHIDNLIITHYEILYVYFIHKSHKIVFNVVRFVAGVFFLDFNTENTVLFIGILIYLVVIDLLIFLFLLLL